mgnify:CR=1 FL=1
MSEEKNQARAMLLMIKGSLLELDQEDRANILDTAESIKSMAKEMAGDMAQVAVAIANLEMSLEDDK